MTQEQLFLQWLYADLKARVTAAQEYNPNNETEAEEMGAWLDAANAKLVEIEEEYDNKFGVRPPPPPSAAPPPWW